MLDSFAKLETLFDKGGGKWKPSAPDYFLMGDGETWTLDDTWLKCVTISSESRSC